MTVFMKNDNEYDKLFKIILVGDSGTGKSTFLTKYINNSFTDMFISTIGVDFTTTKISLDGMSIKLQIWDTAGQERFRTITTTYYRGAHGIMVMFDLTCHDSFMNISNWISDIKTYTMQNVPILLVGTKCDKVNDIQVSREEITQMVQSYGLEYIETSAKTDVNVVNSFDKLTKKINEYVNSKDYNKKHPIKPAIIIQNQPKKDCC